MAVAIYNNRPKSSLNNHSPNEIALMLPQPLIFDKLALKQELEDPDSQTNVDDFLDIFSQFQLRIADEKSRRFSIHENSEETKLKVGDIVLTKPTTVNLGHNRENSGPNEVTRVKSFGSYEIRHFFFNKRTSRNRRHLLRINVSENDLKILRDQSSLYLDNGLIKGSLTKNIPQTDFARSPLDSSQLQITEEKSTQRYNFRKRS
jgi:hypothetical protein